MIPYSHVINIPFSFPFEGEHRWTTFLGEFVKPIVEKEDFPYWFTYYGNFAKFRVYTEKESILKDIEHRMKLFGLTYQMNGDNREEFDATLEGDLGCSRFLARERTGVEPIERAEMILTMLHAGAELFLSTLIQDGHYWREEKNEDLGNNPFESSSRSYIHLLHNLAQSDIEVCSYSQGQQLGLLSEYYFSHHVAHHGHPHSVHRWRIQV